MFRNLLNFEPWRDLVKKSPIMSSVGQYLIMMCTRLTQSDTNKYLMFMCRVRFLLDARPLFSIIIELWLSWCRIDGLRGYPCSWRKHRVHRTAGILSCTPTTSASVELVVFIFGRVMMNGTSNKQKINTTSSTEAEVVVVHDNMPAVLWTQYFL